MAQTILSIAEAFGVCVLGVGSAWFSRKAAKLSEPTGNGFAGDVRESLRSIHNRLDRIDDRIDDLTDRFIDDHR